MTDDKTPMAQDRRVQGEPGRPAARGSTRAIQRMNHQRTAALSAGHQLRPRRQHRALAYNTPRGSVFGYMPELNVLGAIADHSAQSGQPLTNT